MSRNATHSLNLIQSWFQAVITQAGGAEGAISSPDAQQLIPVAPGEAETVIRRSSRLTAIERLSIYSNGYYARLLECLDGCYPVLKKTLGDDVFDSFAIEYLQQYPSHSYTLDLLGEHFSRFLQETRPDGNSGDSDWPDFLIDLATLEWTIGRVFDGPGTEGHGLLTPEVLQSFPAEQFAEAHLLPVASLKLLCFKYPVSAYYTAVRRAAEHESVPVPQQEAERVAVFRRDFVVRRYPLSEPQYALLQKLQAGAQVYEAIGVAAAMMSLDEESLAVTLRSWFRFWSAQGFFASVS